MQPQIRRGRVPVILLDQSGRSDSALTLSAWRSYVGTGRLLDAQLRPHVARAWKRSVLGGCDPTRARAETVSEPQLRRLLEAHAPLIRTVRPFATALSRAAGRDRHAVMLGDRMGRILDVIGDPRSVEGPEAVPGPGALLSESTSGANGIGTPLAEGSYVELVGPEHFIEGFHPFTCQGIPLLDAHGAAAGVLSVSVRRLETAERLRDILFCAAQAIECETIAQTLSVEMKAASTAGAAGVLENLRQDVMQRLASAQLGLEAAARAVARGGRADEVLAAVQLLIGRFRRLADLWRDLVAEVDDASEPIRVCDLVADIVELIETEARIADVSIEWRRDTGAIVLANRQLLAQSVLNRLVTAIQSAGEGGAIRMAVEADPDRAVHVRFDLATQCGTLAPALSLVAGRSE